MSTTLGKITKVDLNDVWKNEIEFSDWLVEEENLKILSDTIGIEITLPKREEAVRSFRVDISAKEDGSNRKIIIENQIEDTDHKHLGQIITYAAGKSADVIIWIVKKARDEHSSAIEWLNQKTDEDIGFFLVEIELRKIGDSLPAPVFNIVEQPNDFAKTMKTLSGVDGNGKLCYEFWNIIKEYSNNRQDFSKLFKFKKPSPQSWTDLAIGISKCSMTMRIRSTKNEVATGIYIGDYNLTNTNLYNNIRNKKIEIEKDLGIVLDENTGNKDATFLITNSFGDLEDKNNWDKYCKWLCDMTIKLREELKKLGLI